jgi:hypothetical protein
MKIRRKKKDYFETKFLSKISQVEHTSVRRTTTLVKIKRLGPKWLTVTNW